MSIITLRLCSLSKKSSDLSCSHIKFSVSTNPRLETFQWPVKTWQFGDETDWTEAMFRGWERGAQKHVNLACEEQCACVGRQISVWALDSLYVVDVNSSSRPDFYRFSDSTQVLCQRNSYIEKWESSLGWNLAIQHTWESCVLRYAPYAHPCNASWTGTHPSVCVDNKLKCWRPTWREAVDSFKFSTIHHPLCSCSWCKGHNKSRNNGHSRESFKLLFKILGNLSISWRDTVHSKLSLDTVNFLSG